MRDYRELVNNFLYGGKREENFIKKLLRGFLSPSLRSFLIRKIGSDYEEELLSELKLRLIEKRDHLQSLKFMNLGYLRSMIRSLVMDAINGVKGEYYSLNMPVFEEEEAKPITYEDIIKDTRDFYAEPEGDILFELLLKTVREEDVVVLCYYFYKKFYDTEVEITAISKDNLYKRWERLRKGRLRDIFDGASPEELRVAVERFLSEVCQKKGYINSVEVKV